MPAPMPPPNLTGLSLAEIARLAADKRLPPLASWNPDHCGDSLMRIARDGTWYHEGRPIARAALVQLFSTILRREPDGSHVLVTPAEKLSIEVEDRPFVAVEMASEGEGAARTLALRLNTGELVVAGPHHALHFEEVNGEPHPCLEVRDGLEALIGRSVFYELVELALAEGAEPPGVWSGGVFFAMASA
jgi:uncharacterized protein